MALKSGVSGTLKLIDVLISPSWTSGVFVVLISVLAIGGTIVLTRIGTATQQSILGLHSVYHESSIGADTNSIGRHLSDNPLFNNAVLFILWGSVGLVVYSVVQGMTNELKSTDDLIHELEYIHVDRQAIIRETIARAAIRLGALAGWWILLWFIARKLFPYTVANAQLTAYALNSVNAWGHMLVCLYFCVLSLHGLVVLTRLMFLRPRLTGNSIMDY